MHWFAGLGKGAIPTLNPAAAPIGRFPLCNRT